MTDKISQATSRIKTLNEMRKLQESRMNESLTNAFITRNPIQLKQLQDQTAEMIKDADADIKVQQDIIQKTIDLLYLIVDLLEIMVMVLLNQFKNL